MWPEGSGPIFFVDLMSGHINVLSKSATTSYSLFHLSSVTYSFSEGMPFPILVEAYLPVSLHSLVPTLVNPPHLLLMCFTYYTQDLVVTPCIYVQC